MRRSDEDSGEQLLFDLPLDGPVPLAADPPRRPARSRSERANAPVPVPPSLDAEGDEGEEADHLAAGSAGERVAIGSRVTGAAADLLIQGSVLVLLLVGSRLLGVRPDLSDAPAFAAFLLVFSFLYTVVPLAFWGQTLGMAWAGLISQNRDGEPLTFGQTARRWLGGVLTVGSLGLPLLLALGGRSLSDLLSGSITYPDRQAG